MQDNKYSTNGDGTATLTIISLKHGEINSLIDEFMVTELFQYRWHINYDGTNYYIATNTPADGLTKKSYKRLHRVVCNATKGKVIDHINNNTLDNRQSNLRIVSQLENCQNSKKNGYHFHKATGKWVAQISFSYEQIHLGLFDQELDAANAHLDAKKYFHPSTPEIFYANYRNRRPHLWAPVV